jgi:hypothetical protein
MVSKHSCCVLTLTISLVNAVQQLLFLQEHLAMLPSAPHIPCAAQVPVAAVQQHVQPGTAAGGLPSLPQGMRLQPLPTQRRPNAAGPAPAV